MPFRQGQKPALRVPMARLESLVQAFAAAGYEEHTGHKVKHRLEVCTFRKRFLAGKSRRQCHVQVICCDGKNLDVFAHTEPDMTTVLDLFTHGFAALLDHANFAAGSRMVRKDLMGFATSV